jgi:hypothetical protein
MSSFGQQMEFTADGWLQLIPGGEGPIAAAS